jgi:hypothetical protein
MTVIVGQDAIDKGDIRLYLRGHELLIQLDNLFDVCARSGLR